MAHRQDAPYRAQDVHEVAEMLRGLEINKGNGKRAGRGGFACKKATFDVAGSDIKVDSWRINDWDYKKPNLPTYSRGLFTTRNSKGDSEIVIRGYDKFFNHGEVRETEWRNVERDTRGPFELSVKENGCIIFMSGLEDGTLLVCSKHSTGTRADTDVSHALAGEKWIDRQLAALGKTRQQLAMKLREMNATAVAELCDDEFEEHVLQYAPEAAGLYLHGLNLNLPEFATYPHHLVDQFADEWAFKKTMYVMKDTIEEVKQFLDSIGETGHYAGRDTEGFVIRCQSKANSGEWHDWFFKYKFDEPYLMYRQWRECTKAVIAGKEPKIKKHKKITSDYIRFARQQLHGNPELAKAYNANHGIIKMRDDFLASCGLKGEDIIRQEIQDGEGGESVSKDVILVPVATIGCGKTTVALALCKLFGWGHVQNDNITAKKGKGQAFVHACCRELESHPAMIADRNNHQKRERQQLMDDALKVVPSAHFVCLQYVHEPHNYDRIRAATRERVLSRGDNHQTIQAGSKGQGEIVKIMEGFMDRFQPVDPEAYPDDAFDTVINLDPCVDSRENLEHVVSQLYSEYPKLFGEQDMPTPDDMDAAIEAALNDYTVDIKHEIKDRNDGRNKPGNSRHGNGGLNGQPNGKPRARNVDYFAVQVSPVRVNAVLDAVFRDTSPAVAKMYNSLKKQWRVQSEFHVTLIHRAMSGDHQEIWGKLMGMHVKATTPTNERPYPVPEPKLGACSVRLERLVWDDRIMAFVVRLSPFDANSETFTSVNKTAHITVGTASRDIKPVESNKLLAQWLQEGSGGENHIQELAVKGNVELGGTVKAVLQKH